MGHHSARLENLENWKGSIRGDMHEISDRLNIIQVNLSALTTLIEERTERRSGSRYSYPNKDSSKE